MRPTPLAAWILAPLLTAAAGACTPAPRAASGPGARPAAATPEAPGAAIPERSPPSAGEPAVPASWPPAAEPISVDFATQVRPILESGCRPCHFPGGKMYDRLPFDRAETIHLLGEKLLTRIKAADDQALIRAFLAEGAGS